MYIMYCFIYFSVVVNKYTYVCAYIHPHLPTPTQPGAPKLANFRGGGGCRGLAKIRQREGGGVVIIFYCLRDKHITF